MIINTAAKTLTQAAPCKNIIFHTEKDAILRRKKIRRHRVLNIFIP